MNEKNKQDIVRRKFTRIFIEETCISNVLECVSLCRSVKRKDSVRLFMIHVIIFVLAVVVM